MGHKARFVASVLLVVMILSALAGITQAAPSEQVAQVALPRLIVNTSFLNVRTGPGVQYTILLTVVGGTELPVLGIAPDRVWYLVATAAGTGWVNVEFTIPRGDFRFVPEVDLAQIALPAVVPFTPVTIGLPGYVVDGQGGGGGLPLVTATGTTPAFAGRFRAALAVESANLRTAPVNEAPWIRILFKNDAVDYPIVGRTVDQFNVEWLQLSVEGVGTGWIEAPKLILRLNATARDVVTIVAEAVQLSSFPGGDFTGLPTVFAGTEAYLLNITQDGQMVQIELADGTVGWVPFHSVVTRQGTTTDDVGDVPDDPFGIVVDGQGGGGGAPVVFGAINVIPVTVPQLASPLAIVNTGALNIRSGPGAQYPSITTVPGGTELTVLAIASDNVWYLVQGAFGQGWINRDFVIFRGVFDHLPVIDINP